MRIGLAVIKGTNFLPEKGSNSGHKLTQIIVLVQQRRGVG